MNLKYVIYIKNWISDTMVLTENGVTPCSNKRKENYFNEEESSRIIFSRTHACFYCI